MSAPPTTQILLAAGFAATLVSCALPLSDERVIRGDFIDYLRVRLISENPIPGSTEFLGEYRTGPWTWNVTEIIHSYPHADGSRSDLIEIIEISMPLDRDHVRFSEEEAARNERALEINRMLDSRNTDRIRIFYRGFSYPAFLDEENFGLNVNNSGLNVDYSGLFENFGLSIHVYKENDEEYETIDAYLRWFFL